MKNSDFCLVRDLGFLKHAPDSPHPESPDRIKPLLRLLEENPQLNALPGLTLRRATEASLLPVHAKEMISRIVDTRGKTGWLDPDTYFTPDSAETALCAAGCTIDLALKIWKKEFRRGFTLVRPPGHHATPTEVMGFCLFNNVALAVAAVLEESSQARVAIVDFDLHHGNGTQWAFYDNPNVLFLSSHRYPFYPGTGALEEVGEGRGRGTTVNFPIGTAEGDEFFVSLYRDIAVPILESFAPEMIFVSAGFDGHLLDPMQGFRMGTETYATLAELLISVAEKSGGKILFALEGGYHPEALAASAIKVIECLRDASRTPGAPDLAPGASAEAKLETFRKFHSQFFRL